MEDNQHRHFLNNHHRSSNKIITTLETINTTLSNLELVCGDGGGGGGGSGSNGADGDSAYEIAVNNGFSGTETEWLASLVGASGSVGVDGDSAYEIAVSNGFVGSEQDWLNSLIGQSGANGINGLNGVGQDGADGDSAFDIAVSNGFSGTESEWLASLVGNDGVDGNDGGAISTYTKATLPLNGTAGLQAFITDGTTSNTPCMGYFYQGKWYRVFDNTLIKDNTIDLYIFAGQSNMDGQASTSGVSTADRTDTIFYLETASSSSSVIDSTWSGLTLGGTSNHASNLFGPEIGFHDRVKQLPTHYTNPIGILKFTRGATDLARDWNTTHSSNYLFHKFKDALDDGRNKLTSSNYSYNIKGLVWFQGEGDTLSSTDANAYQTNLTNFISAIRTHLVESNLPVVICSIDRPAEAINSTTVRTAQQNVANSDINTYYVPTENYSHKADGVHLDTQGMLDTGEAVVNALAGVFNVSNLSPLVWYDATDLTVSPVSQWNDKSYNARHISQSNINNQPTYSNNEVGLNGSQYLFNTTPIMYNNGSMEVFIVASGLAQSDTRLVGEGSSTNNSPFYGIQSGQSVQQGGASGDIQKMSIFIRNDNSSTLVAGTVNNSVAFDGTFKILHWKDTGTQVQGRINGGSFGFKSYTRSGSVTVNRFCIGGVLRSAFSSGFTGSIKEIIITPVNTNTDREKVEGYLAHKWGLEGDLPSSHPYKTVAP